MPPDAQVLWQALMTAEVAIAKEKCTSPRGVGD